MFFQSIDIFSEITETRYQMISVQSHTICCTIRVSDSGKSVKTKHWDKGIDIGFTFATDSASQLCLTLPEQWGRLQSSLSPNFKMNISFLKFRLTLIRYIRWLSEPFAKWLITKMRRMTERAKDRSKVLWSLMTRSHCIDWLAHFVSHCLVGKHCQTFCQLIDLIVIYILHFH